jgi:hypothetical protein
MDSWQAATGTRPRVDPMDRRLHDERTVGRQQRRHRMEWSTLPDGTLVVVADQPALVLADRLVPWQAQPDGYGSPVRRPITGLADVLTPPSTVAVLRHGYQPVLAPVP